MKLIKNWKKKRAYKNVCKPVLRRHWYYVPNALMTKCKEVYTMKEGRDLAEELVRIAKSINIEAVKCRQGTAICAGLAANQIGINRRVFVTMQKDGSFKTYINPVIIKKEGEPYIAKEHCFSSNFKPFYVKRYPKITIKADGLVTKRLSGLQAQSFQHEFDHLEGII